MSLRRAESRSRLLTFFLSGDEREELKDAGRKSGRQKSGENTNRLKRLAHQSRLVSIVTGRRIGMRVSMRNGVTSRRFSGVCVCSAHWMSGNVGKVMRARRCHF